MTAGLCSRKCARMTPFCPSLRRRLSGKWKRSIEARAEEEEELTGRSEGLLDGEEEVHRDGDREELGRT